MKHIFSLLLVAMLLMASSAVAQSTDAAGERGLSRYLNYFDVGNAAVGLAVYQGDIDGNEDNSVSEYLASGSISVFVGMEHEGENFTWGPELRYDRFTSTTPYVDLGANLISLDVMASYPLKFFSEGFVSLYATVGAALAINNIEFDDPDEVGEDDYTEVKDGTIVLGMFTLGVRVGDSVRLGVRMSSNDFLDSTGDYKDADWTSGRDYLSFITVGYRFDL